MDRASKGLMDFMDKNEGREEGSSFKNINKERVRQGYKAHEDPNKEMENDGFDNKKRWGNSAIRGVGTNSPAMMEARKGFADKKVKLGKDNPNVLKKIKKIATKMVAAGLTNKDTPFDIEGLSRGKLSQ